MYKNRKNFLINGKTKIKPKSNNVQVNTTILMEWQIELENLVRIYSVEEGETITFLGHMRKFNKKKLFGKSIKNRCSSGFRLL